MKKCKIFTGGAPIYCQNFNKKDFEGCLIIAADSGCAQLKLLEKSGIILYPDILLGDMDSFDKASAIKSYPEARFISFPPEKDYTDTQLALSVARDMGCDDIEIIGGTGNRADHYLANLALLRKCAKDGVGLWINDGKNRITYVTDGKVSVENDGKFRYFSVLPDDEPLSGVTIKGAKYEIEEAEIDRDIPISVSNEITNKKCEISVGHGRFYFIICSD